jgi:hypothetical protein
VAGDDTVVLEVAGRSVRITSPGKVVFPRGTEPGEEILSLALTSRANRD